MAPRKIKKSSNHKTKTTKIKNKNSEFENILALEDMDQVRKRLDQLELHIIDLISQKNFSTAYEHSKNFINLDRIKFPDRPVQGYWNLGISAYYLGKLQEAREYFSEDLKSNSDDIDNIIMLATIDRREGKFEESGMRFLSIPVDKRNDFYYLEQAKLLMSKKSFDLAEASLKKALKYNNEIYFSETLLELANLYFTINKFDNFQEIFCTLQQYPLININPLFIALNAKNYFRLNKVQEAIESLENFIRENQPNGDLAALLMQLYNNDKKHQEAICLGEKLLKTFPNNTIILHESFVASLSLGKLDEAKSYYTKIDKRYIEREIYYCDLGQYFSQKKEYEKALSSYLKAAKYSSLSTCPSEYNFQIYHNIARISYSLKKDDICIEYWNKIFTTPNSSSFFSISARRDMWNVYLELIFNNFESKEELLEAHELQISLDQDASDFIEDFFSKKQEEEIKIQKEVNDIISNDKLLWASHRQKLKPMVLRNELQKLQDISESSWGNLNPDSEGVIPLTWKGLDDKKTPIYGFITPAITNSLEKPLMKRFNDTLHKQRITSNKTNETGVEIFTVPNERNCMAEIKILGTFGDDRLGAGEPIRNAKGEELYIFNTYFRHKGRGFTAKERETCL